MTDQINMLAMNELDNYLPPDLVKCVYEYAVLPSYIYKGAEVCYRGYSVSNFSYMVYYGEIHFIDCKGVCSIVGSGVRYKNDFLHYSELSPMEAVTSLAYKECS